MPQDGPDWPPPEILRLRDAGALFAISHSGGKDSQAMMIRLRAIVPADQMLVVYADLGEVVWPGTLTHIKATIGPAPLLTRLQQGPFDAARGSVGDPFHR